MNSNQAGKGDRPRGNSKEELNRYRDNYVAIFGDKGIQSTKPATKKVTARQGRRPSAAQLTHRELSKTDTGLRI